MSLINAILPPVDNSFSSVQLPFAETQLRENPFAADSLSPSFPLNAENWKPERPQLTPPHSLPASHHRLLRVTEESRKLSDNILNNLSTRLDQVKQKTRDISAENMQKLRESAERTKTSNFWSILNKVATCLLSAISFVFGISLLASGGTALVGGAMIASGVLSLANFALTEWGAWDWVADQLAHKNEERKNKIAMILPAAAGIVAGGIGLVGSVHGIASGALQFAEKMAFIAQTALSIFDGVTTLGKGIADARLLYTQADLKMINARSTVEHQNFDSLISEITGSMSDFKSIKALTKRTIQTIINYNNKAIGHA